MKRKDVDLKDLHTQLTHCQNDLEIALLQKSETIRQLEVLLSVVLLLSTQELEAEGKATSERLNAEINNLQFQKDELQRKLESLEASVCYSLYCLIG